MNAVDLINIKRRAEELTGEQIEEFVEGASGKGNFRDYQLAAMLMAIAINGMTPRETVDLTMSMARSGDMLDLSKIEGIKVDKHSTGGVGDTTTLVLAPIVASCGVKVAKMSGRGLGHTGGTLDKLESIPGLSVSLSEERFIEQVNKISLAVVGQTASLAPADKALYALRDVTATVDSMPLIVSSILSKKIASGADVVVLDVKAGNGATMPTAEKSLELARTMVDIGNLTGRRFEALVTDMSQPLGLNVGNAIEVEEAISILRGDIKGDLMDVSVRLAGEILFCAGVVKSREEARKRVARAIDSGAGLEKLGQMIAWQGGDGRVIDNVRLLPQPVSTLTEKSRSSGYIAKIDTIAIGNAAKALGAGRITKEDDIDPSVGIKMKVRLGDYVSKGDALCDLLIGRTSKTETALAILDGAFEYSDEKPEPASLFYNMISGD
ncbi:MAG: thymidine phosphorylase [Clostridia bacterium]|nr:thymidine phosphorylase [Clostridia bacterium]